jgi:hypothetical protein
MVSSLQFWPSHWLARQLPRSSPNQFLRHCLALLPRLKTPGAAPSGLFTAFTDLVIAARNTASVSAITAANILEACTFYSLPVARHTQSFLTHGEWDADLPNDMLYEYFAKLTNAPYKRFVQIGECTLTVIVEKNRMQRSRPFSGRS